MYKGNCILSEDQKTKSVHAIPVLALVGFVVDGALEVP